MSCGATQHLPTARAVARSVANLTKDEHADRLRRGYAAYNFFFTRLGFFHANTRRTIARRWWADPN
jgi:hypothetical protein